MVDQHDIARRHAGRDRGRYAVLVGHGRGYAQRERERVGLAPCDARDAGAAEWIGPGRHLGQPHGVPVTRVGVGRLARPGPDHLLEDQHVTDRERGDLAVERGARRAFGEAAVLGAPRVELHPVVTLEEGDVGEGLEDRRTLRRDRPIRCREVHRRGAGDTGQEAGGDVGDGVDPREEDPRGGHRVVDEDLDPRPGVAAVVHRVVDETGVAPDRDPPARGAEVRLGRDGVLAVGEVVADVRHQLDERDPDVGRVPLAPVGIERADPVEQEPPEGRVVAGEIVEVDRPAGPRADRCGAAGSRSRSGSRP